MEKPQPPGLVLDTNVVLDWLVFRNPSFDPIEAAIRRQDLAWWSTAGLRAEFEHVLARGLDPRWPIDAAGIEVAWRQWAHECPGGSSAAAPRCRDADDQKFIDFAVHSGARWLLTRDRDLLALRHRAASAHGVQILTPELWNAQNVTDQRAGSADVGTHSYPQDTASN